MKIYRIAAFFALLLGMSSARAQVALKVGQPVAIDGSPVVGYFVLTRRNVVYHYIPPASALQFKNRFDVQYGDSFDLAYAKSAGQDSVLITSWSNDLHRGYISRYTPDGHLINTWTISRVPVGISFDSTSGYAYYSTADTNEIYRFNILDSKGSPKYVCEIPGAERLGSVALDPGHTLFVADSSKGTISRVDLNSTRVSAFAGNLRQPSALRYDAQQRTLFVADSIAHHVFAINTAQPGATPVDVVSAKLSMPSGIASGVNGALLISDYDSNWVYQALPSFPPSQTKVSRR